MFKKETILLTGASGSMGFSTFKFLQKKKESIDLVVLIRPSDANKERFKQYLGVGKIGEKREEVFEEFGLKIVWGDACVYEDVKLACQSIDIVLNPMACVPPQADIDPELAYRVNVGATENLIKAIIEEADGPQRIRFVHVGSVAQYGDRLPPFHRIRVGDPMIPSVYDYYAVSKTLGERIVIDSGIKHWACIRQTFIGEPDFIEKCNDPILFHQPLSTALELITRNDAGYGLAELAGVPHESDFWGSVYNMSGGERCRTTYHEYLERMVKIFSGNDYRDIYEKQWFALKNFHCGWFEDSDRLNQYVNYQTEGIDDHFDQVFACTKKMFGTDNEISIDKSTVRKAAQKLLTNERSTKFWFENNNIDYLSAFYGSEQRYIHIKGWGDEDHIAFPQAGLLVDHGCDSDAPTLTIEELHQMAKFRAGELLSKEWSGDEMQVLSWRDSRGNIFSGSVNLIVRAGHWSPYDLLPPWEYTKLSQTNQFYRQLFKDKYREGDQECFDGSNVFHSFSNRMNNHSRG